MPSLEGLRDGIQVLESVTIWSQSGKTEMCRMPETLDLNGWGTRIRT